MDKLAQFAEKTLAEDQARLARAKESAKLLDRLNSGHITETDKMLILQNARNMRLVQLGEDFKLLGKSGVLSEEQRQVINLRDQFAHPERIKPATEVKINYDELEKQIATLDGKQPNIRSMKQAITQLKTIQQGVVNPEIITDARHYEELKLVSTYTKTSYTAQTELGNLREMEKYRNKLAHEYEDYRGKTLKDFQPVPGQTFAARHDATFAGRNADSIAKTMLAGRNEPEMRQAMGEIVEPLSKLAHHVDTVSLDEIRRMAANGGSPEQVQAVGELVAKHARKNKDIPQWAVQNEKAISDPKVFASVEKIRTNETLLEKAKYDPQAKEYHERLKPITIENLAAAKVIGDMNQKRIAERRTSQDSSPAEKTSAPSSSPINKINVGMSTAAMVGGLNRREAGIQNGNKAEELIGDAEIVVGGATAVRLAMGKKLPIVGPMLTAGEGGYQVGTAMAEARNNGENIVVAGIDKTTQVGLNVTANVTTLGLAGNASDVLYQRSKDQVKESVALSEKINEMRDGKREWSTREIVSGYGNIVGKNITAVGEAVTQTLPGQAVTGVVGVVKLEAKIQDGLQQLKHKYKPQTPQNLTLDANNQATLQGYGNLSMAMEMKGAMDISKSDPSRHNYQDVNWLRANLKKEANELAAAQGNKSWWNNRPVWMNRIPSLEEQKLQRINEAALPELDHFQQQMAQLRERKQEEPSRKADSVNDPKLLLLAKELAAKGGAVKDNSDPTKQYLETTTPHKTHLAVHR